ncbi:hypothetical protein FNV43_RR01179 [Rhamnella rubrinervis]|uniref:Uncharacterized protein n=1 Tax=Rhamnella rubrinervis TaxID=2594499 RepID=A0A8K0HP57_9ROSA|nr:hypothetical protein FNV43_RR01179 [Rhamnella rubrinervis]
MDTTASVRKTKHLKSPSLFSSLLMIMVRIMDSMLQHRRTIVEQKMLLTGMKVSVTKMRASYQTLTSIVQIRAGILTAKVKIGVVIQNWNIVLHACHRHS